MKYVMIVNPTAGNGYAKEAASLVEGVLKDNGKDYSIRFTEYPGHATALAMEAAQNSETEAVLSVGGDGTAFEVACGLFSKHVPMGIIPAGTGNDFVKTIRVPRKPEEAIRFILDSQPSPIDVGTMGDRVFLNVCGTGFDVTVLDYAEAEKKKYKGLTPYLIGLIKAIRHYKPVHVSLTMDGRKVEKNCLVCSIANGQYIGGGIPICPDADPADGLLDVVMVDDLPRWKIPFYLPGLLTGKILGWKITERIKVHSVSLSSDHMRINVDGEIMTRDHVCFDLMPSAISIYRQ